jgi:hypothetical protein
MKMSLHALHRENFTHSIVGLVLPDESGDGCNPREHDNLADLYCWHRRYSLGDHQDRGEYDAMEFYDTLLSQAKNKSDNDQALLDSRNAGEEVSRSDMHTAVERYYYMRPIYMYDHSGITISTSPFSCSWDSGQVGWGVLSHEKARREIGGDEATLAERALSQIDAEVKHYDAYLRGDIAYYAAYDVSKLLADGASADTLTSEQIYDRGYELDSCYGFVGDTADCIEQMRDAAQCYVKHKEKEIAEAQHWAERDVVTKG